MYPGVAAVGQEYRFTVRPLLMRLLSISTHDAHFRRKCQ